MKHDNISPETMSTTDVVRVLLREDRLWAVVLASGMILSSLLEGLGVMTLILAVQIVTGDLAEIEEGGVLAEVVAILQWSGIGTQLGPVLFATVMLIFGKTVLHFSIITFGEYVAADIQAKARQRLIRATLDAKYSFFLRHRVGRFVNALSTEANSVSSLFVRICQSGTMAVNIVVYLAVAVALSIEISIAAIIVATLMMFVFSSLVGISRRTGGAITILNKAFVTRLTDGLGGIKTLKVMARESFLGPHLEREVRQLKKQQVIEKAAKQVLIDSREPFIVVFLSVGLYVAIERVGVEVSILAGLALIFHRLINSVGQFQSLYQGIVSLVPMYQSFAAILEAAQSNHEGSTGQRSYPTMSRAIELRDVSFCYDGQTPTLKNVSLEIPAGQITLLMGPSGAGKTTILDIVCGLYEPSSGEVCLDGIPLRSGPLRDYRAQIGYVAQDSVLFYDTIRNNLALGDKNISEASIKEALVSANAWGFVSALPNGVDQIVGDDGMSFSGGEKQRLALARALVREPTLLILDEATTALDPENEQEIIDVLRALKGKITMLGVSHQPALKTIADRIYQIDRGQVGLGTYPE